MYTASRLIGLSHVGIQVCAPIPPVCPMRCTGVSLGLDGCEVCICVIRVPVCARVSRACPECVPAPPGVFLPVLEDRHDFCS